MHAPRTLLFSTLATLALALATPAAAQVPSIGDWYEDSSDVGFKIRMPKGWNFAPGQPGDPNQMGTYAPPHVRYINIAPDDVLWLEAHLVKFDRRPREEPEAATTDEDGRTVVDVQRLRRQGAENLTEYIERHFQQASGVRETESSEFRVKDAEATEHLFTARSRMGGTEFHIWAVKYSLEPDLDVAVVFNGPARDWRKWHPSLRRMAQSFRTVEVVRPAAAEGREGDSAYRTQKRAQLMLEVARNPGWELHETENYFVVSAVDDAAFMRELLQRLEAIRKVYEELYPAAEAERIRLVARQRELEKKDEKGAGEGQDGKPGGDDPEKGPEVVFRTASGVSPQELSRCSVVRVCASRQQYQQYGGPTRSAGYWNWVTEELVIFDDKEVGGRRDTWATLNHEAFHQYIFYFYGNISPHYWYNEGTGDFFSGYQYRNGRFTLKKFDWRERTIQQMIREGRYVPLKEFVRFEREQYYGGSPRHRTTIGDHYAQGWAFIYFLRTGKGSARCWNPAWDTILDVYLEVFAATSDLDQAVDTAFQGVDWQELEDCWKGYIR